MNCARYLYFVLCETKAGYDSASSAFRKVVRPGLYVSGTTVERAAQLSNAWVVSQRCYGDGDKQEFGFIASRISANSARLELAQSLLGLQCLNMFKD